jgi:CRISPR/Cas system CSM-associated protein Csm3 (group 7 of RAMP superfamily)
VTTASPPQRSADTTRGTHVRSASFLVFVLRFTEPGGVTVPGRAIRDAEAARDRAHVLLDTGPDGQPQLPGTSLAGALREMIRTAHSEERADDLFGMLLEAGSSEQVDAVASRIWVLGSRILAGAAPGEFRASTKISRERGAAEAQTLRVEEVLPAGSRFEVFLRWDNAEPEEVKGLAQLLAGWRPLIGRGVSRGRGRCAVDEVRYGTLHLDQPQDLLRWLAGSGPDLAREVAAETVQLPSSPAGSEAMIRVRLSVVGPWRIGNGEKPAGEREPIPMLRAGAGFIVPGSSLKGLLRSRAEFIMRSTGAMPHACEQEPAESCWICAVFGHGGGRDETSASVGQRARIRVPDAAVSGAQETCRTHIAIDRFTGGVLPGALYTMEALETGTFDLTVEPMTKIAPELDRQIRAVLRLVLEDLNDGIIGMGGGTARGYGSVTVDFGSASGLPSLADARSELAGMVRNHEHAAG